MPRIPSSQVAPGTVQAAYTFKAWNDWGGHTHRSMLKFNSRVEQMPTPQYPRQWREWKAA